MLKQEIMLDWAARHRYPQLVLSSRDVLSSGRRELARVYGKRNP